MPFFLLMTSLLLHSFNEKETEDEPNGFPAVADRPIVENQSSKLRTTPILGARPNTATPRLLCGLHKLTPESVSTRLC